MGKLNELIFLLKQDIPLKELKQQLNMNNQELLEYMKMLKKIGYYYEYHIFDDGIANLSFNVDKNGTGFNIYSKKNKVSALAISDIHCGSDKERPDLLKEVYQYATENDIHLIFNLGDLIEGKKSEYSVDAQLEKLYQIYPYDSSIQNIVLLGNHDYHSLYYDHYDISENLFCNRDDFIITGYGLSLVSLNNVIIGLHHDLSIVKNPPQPNIMIPVHLYGHSHYYKTTSTLTNLSVHLPTLSDCIFLHKQTIPSFLKIDFYFKNNQMKKISIQNKAFADELITASEIEYSVPVLKKKK
ncbi:metallophosphoesterase [bacterium]|nr:metallophosphoesterase [bacterium]